MTGANETRQEDVLVLYGSNRGISEEAAKNFAARAKTELSYSDGDNGVVVTANPILMELDDFLIESRWTRLVVIFVSSFGRGDAPFGARKFRKQLCDEWIRAYKEVPEMTQHLEGIHFALCGQGASCYKDTYQQNPKKIAEALTLAGAKLVGERGESDNSSDTVPQQKAIENWVDSVLPQLSEVLALEPLSKKSLQAMQTQTRRD